MRRGSRRKRLADAQRDELVVWRANLGPCVVCPLEGGECVGPVQPHHVTEARTLKKHGLHQFLYDVRNRLPVCEWRHEQHTSAFRRIPREALTLENLAFARAMNLGYLIERFYPETMREVA